MARKKTIPSTTGILSTLNRLKTRDNKILGIERREEIIWPLTLEPFKIVRR